MRVKSVMEEISGEKVDIITLSDNIVEVIGKSLTPAEVLKVEVNEEAQTANVFILPSERAKAIGKNGININLASNLT
jgi:N utilization substance protein A